MGKSGQRGKRGCYTAKPGTAPAFLAPGLTSVAFALYLPAFFEMNHALITKYVKTCIFLAPNL